MYIHWFPAHWRYTDMFAAGGLTYDEAQIVVQCGFVGFVLGGTLGHPDNWKPSAEIELLKTFQSNLCFLHLHSLRWTGGRWQSTPGFPPASPGRPITRLLNISTQKLWYTDLPFGYQ